MTLPTRDEAVSILNEHVKDSYQVYHAQMVAIAMEGYATLFKEDKNLWYITGLLHDIDFERYPETHPKESLVWFKKWNFSEELSHAVEAHAYGYNGFSVLPKTKLASALMACDEISGIFYAYKKLNPIPYSNMKVSSIKKRLSEKTFAGKIDRETIYRGCELLGITIDDHIANLINFFSVLK